MKFEKIPKDDFLIKIELDAKEANDLNIDLNDAEDDGVFETATKEFHKQLQALL